VHRSAGEKAAIKFNFFNVFDHPLAKPRPPHAWADGAHGAVDLHPRHSSARVTVGNIVIKIAGSAVNTSRTREISEFVFPCADLSAIDYLWL
jgi:hypothetical protein